HPAQLARAADHLRRILLALDRRRRGEKRPHELPLVESLVVFFFFHISRWLYRRRASLAGYTCIRCHVAWTLAQWTDGVLSVSIRRRERRSWRSVVVAVGLGRQRITLVLREPLRPLDARARLGIDRKRG